ncbi:uncharacterized protein [Glycine max]|uniref:uncharacterized protein n=1 Tax=Glycine max TaxID=3847 RepID=UPI0003DE7C63|nr:uncharacterized protein LOC100808131 [Glycine max]|eukprot:XP_006596860.1 uncharacterized protein LOC100808131 [Glycine max]
MAEDLPQGMTLEDYSSSATPQYFTNIAKPEVQAVNITYPHSLIQLIQGNLFHGLPNEDPYAYLATYIEICNMVKIVGVPKDAIRINPFSFSLVGEAKRWLHSFKGNSLWTWEGVVEKFLKKYFLESKTAKGKVEISSFHQFPDESLSEALDHFHGLLQKTPTHGFSEPIQLNIFINNLQPHSKQLLNASAGGKIKLKTSEEAMELIENMTASDHVILRDRAYAPTKKSLLELTSQDAMLSQNKLLAKQLETLTETLSQLPQQLHAVHLSPSPVMHIEGCNIYGGVHESSLCMAQDDAFKEVNYKVSQNHQGFYQGGLPRYYQQGNFSQGQGWRSHPGNNFNKDQGGSSNRPPKQGPNLYERTTKLEDTLTQFMQVSLSIQKSTKLAIKNLEKKENAEEEKRVDGVLEDVSNEEGKDTKREEDDERKENDKNILIPKTKSQLAREARREIPPAQVKEASYPLVPSKKDKERYFERFINIFKKLEITIPFGEALQQMLLYTKFLKDLLTKKGVHQQREHSGRGKL